MKIELSKKLHVSEDAVKKWVAGVSGPVDLELVKEIADYFDCDYHELLSEKMEDKEMTKDMSFMEIATERQRIATRDRVRDIYEALVEAVDKVQEYFYREYYDYKKSDLVKLYNTEYEEAEMAVGKVKFLLLKYDLDVPEDLKDKILTICMTEASSFLMDASCAFIIGEENEETMAELIYKMQFEQVEYFNKLKEVFGEFAVK